MCNRESIRLHSQLTFSPCRSSRFRESEGDLAQYPRATTPTRLIKLYPQPGVWMNWPPPTTIDDKDLQVLDYRFKTVLGRQ